MSVSTELRRIAHRRITKVVAVLSVGLVALIGVVSFFTHSSAPPDLVAAAEIAATNQADCMQYHDWGDATAAEIEENCYQDPAWYVTDRNFHMQSLLLAFTSGTDEWKVARESVERSAIDQGDLRLVDGRRPPDVNPAQGYSGTLGGFGVAMFLIVAVLGSSLLGADWRSKSIETQLTWQPNRRRLFAGKIAAAAIVGSSLAAAMSALLVVAHVPAAMWRGDFGGTGVGFWADVALAIGRIAVAGAVAASFGGAVATLFRNTVAGVGAVFGLGALGVTVAMLAGGPLSGVDIFRNVSSWISTGDVARSVELVAEDGSIYGFELVVHGFWVAGAVIVGYAMAAAVVGAASFGRRDIS